jgi:NH3-dependent NAD+ synthetase
MRNANNLERYAKLMQPLARGKASANIDAFFDAVGALREKYHMLECLVVVKLNVEYSDKQIGEAVTSAHFGSQLEAEPLAAYALGNARARVREHINKLVANKGTEEAK